MVAYHRSHPGAMKEGGHARATDGVNPQALAVLMDVAAAGRAETASLSFPELRRLQVVGPEAGIAEAASLLSSALRDSGSAAGPSEG
jgi:hypothetical protein